MVEPVKSLFDKSVVEDSLAREWTSATRNIKCPCRTRASARAKSSVERLRDSWQHLLRDRATRSLTYNDEQFHSLEKIKVAETGKKLKSLLNDDVKPAVSMIAECVADWYKMGQANYVQVQILEKDVSSYEEQIDQMTDILSHVKNGLISDIDTKMVATFYLFLTCQYF